MMKEDKILLTTRYAVGDMDMQEITDFELSLKTDAELEKLLSSYQNINQTLKLHLAPDAIDQQFKATLAGFNNTYFAPQAKIIDFKSRLKWLSGVAAILIMGLLLWAPWHNNLYNQYAGNSQMLVTERSATAQNSLDVAANFFNQKNYAAAKPLLAKLYQQQPQNAMVSYYYGLTLLETEQSATARTILTKIYNSQTAFKYDAAYYIALSYLKENNKADCKLWLQKIPEGTSHYKMAKELILDL